MSEKLTTEEFKKKVFDFEANQSWKYEGELPAIVDFMRTGAGHAKWFHQSSTPLVKSTPGKLKVYKINTDEEQALSAAFGIQSIPSLLFIPKSGDPRMSMGALPKAQILKAMKDVMAVE